MTDKKTEKKEHPQAKWLRAIADGETLQYRYKQGDDAWVTIGPLAALEVLLDPYASTNNYRIKPRTITIGKCEVAEPMREAPKRHTCYFYLSAAGGSGVEEINWIDDGHDAGALATGMCWLKREDAELAAKAITELLTGKSS